MEFHVFCFVCFLLQQIFLTGHGIGVCVFLTSGFNCPRGLAHIHFVTFAWECDMPHVLRPRSSMPGFTVLIVFFTGIWIVLILCLSSNLLKLDVKCWYGSQATPVGFSVAVWGLFLACRACWMSQLLYPFFLNVCFRCCISSYRLLSQMVCSQWMRMEGTTLFFC
jgi:hypothetical protein